MKTIGRLGHGSQWRNLGALLWGMIIAPLILGTPFFSAVAQETSMGGQVLNTQCDVSLKPYRTGSLACTPVTGFLGTDTQCSGSIRQYPAQYGCLRAAQGIRCMKVTFPPRYIEYSASGAVSGKSTLQILMCLGLDQGLLVHPGFLWVNRCGRMPFPPGGSSYVRHRSLPTGSGPFGPLEGG